MDIVYSLENYGVPRTHIDKLQTEFNHLDAELTTLRQSLLESQMEVGRLKKEATDAYVLGYESASRLNEDERNAQAYRLIELTGLINNVYNPLRAKHFESECLTCREGNPCEHKRLMDLSVKPLPTNSASRVLELARVGWEYYNRLYEFEKGYPLTSVVKAFSRYERAAAAIQPEDKILLGIKEGE